MGLLPGAARQLIERAGVRLAPVVLSLNASFMYLGFSLGAALGGFTLLHASPRALGWVGAACELLALALVVVTGRRAGSRAARVTARREPARSSLH